MEEIERELIELGEKMHIFHGKKVIFDADAAAFFNVRTDKIKEIVKEDSKKFSEDFAFRLSVPELCLFSRPENRALKKCSGSNYKYPPLAFTNKGFAMLASILRTEKALQTQLYLLRRPPKSRFSARHCLLIKVLLFYEPMKKEIHPTYFENATWTCACGATYVMGSTKENISVEICSNCHPFYTGTEKNSDTAGRIEKFKARSAGIKAKKPKAKKTEETTPETEA